MRVTGGSACVARARCGGMEVETPSATQQHPMDMTSPPPQASLPMKRKSTDSVEAEGEGGEAGAVAEGVEGSSSSHAGSDIAIVTESMRQAQVEAEQELAKTKAAEASAAPVEAPAVPVVPILLRGDPQAAKATKKVDKLDQLLNKAQAYSDFILKRQAEKFQLPTSMDEVASGSGQKGGKKKTAKRSKKGTAEDKAELDAKSSKAMAEASAAMQEARASTSGDMIAQPVNLVGGTLKPYQCEGLQWMMNLFYQGLNGILADEMGLGKTIQAISLIAALRLKEVNGPFIIIAPLATLPNWILEFGKWLPSVPVMLYHGSKAEREGLRAQLHGKTAQVGAYSVAKPSFPVIITSYEIAQIDRVFLQRYQWKWMIIDEGHRMKNRESKLFRELKEFSSGNRLLLTGTPIQNTLEELWTLLNFVQPDIFEDLSVFQSWFGFDNIGRDISVDDIIDEEHRERVVSKLHEVLRPFLLRRLKRDVNIGITEKKELVVYADMSEIQRDYYRLLEMGHLREALLKEGVEEAKTMKTLNVQMNLRKVCNHPFLVGEPRTRNGEPLSVAKPEALIEACGKLKLLDRMLKKLHKNQHRVLIFSQMTEVLNVLESYLYHREWDYCRIDGSVKIGDRQSQIEDFNKDKSIFVFLLSTRAGGLGINLAGADTVILYDSDWNPHPDLQAQDRCHRIGQTKNVAVYRLLTKGSVEIEMMETQISKKKLERLSIVGGDYRKAGKRSRGEMTTDELRRLLQDDVHNLQRMSTLEVSEADIPEDELERIMDRVRVFAPDLPEEGKMYDVVNQTSESLLSGMT